MKVEKRPGWDWEIEYEDDEGADVMIVFGAMSIDEAIRDALSSFLDDDLPTVVGARRLKQ